MERETRQRLAVAAPLMLIIIATTLLALVWKPALLILPVLAALLILPMAVGLWVFAGRGALSRVLLSAWAPAGQAIAFVAVVGLVRLAGDGSGVVLGLLVLAPVLGLLVFGLTLARRPDRRTAVAFGVLWAIAIVEAAGAIPLAEFWGGSAGLESLAGVVTLLFAPGIAFGAWLALLAAARVAAWAASVEVDAEAGAASFAGASTVDTGGQSADVIVPPTDGMPL